MEIITPEEMQEKLGGTNASMRPLKPEPRSSVGDMWPIPFEYHGVAKGTRISVSSAKVIAGELLLAVIAVEMEQLRSVLDDERARSANLTKRVVDAEAQRDVAFQEAAQLRRKLKKRSR